jgi:site-specific DNA-methyltransferase (adenine-specific)
VGAFPETETNAGTARSMHRAGMWGIETTEGRTLSSGDSGSAARFFYTAKADADDRLGSKHPTVKPVSLIRWLARLVTPPGGLILDPFAGTGTLGEAAFYEGFRAILFEREEEYQADIRRRMALALAGPDERGRETIKAKGLAEYNAGPLFEGVT